MDFLHALRFSRYASRMLAAHPHEREWLASAVDAPFAWHEETAGVRAALTAHDPALLARAVRLLRRRVYLHTMARDLGGRADLAEVCGAVTTLAERTIAATVELHTFEAAERHGLPRTSDGAGQALIVVGMGKLGGGELNVSSDIDLVFLFGEEGETAGARPISHREFFERVGRRVIASLHDVTADGYVFRVDMRLRPYGESGPLAVPLSSFEQYLVAQGRAWERYAWLKARPITGHSDTELAALVTPFVFRKYLDFDAYEGLRDIHRQIREQGKRRDYAVNIKLGPGGIREVEFSVQALQLVRGGREPALRERGTLAALAVIAERELLPRSISDALRDAYVFLRNLEHRLQYRDDQQTQSLPEDAGEREALAAAMGFSSVTAFEEALAAHRDAVAEHFATVFGDPDEIHQNALSPATDSPNPQAFSALWRDELTPDAAQALLRDAGFRDPEGLLATLDRVRRSGRYAQLPALSRTRFDTLLPRLLDVAAREHGDSADAHAVFIRLLSLLETVSRRSAYLALLTEHPPLLPRITQLMSASAWAADYLTRRPILLDELLDARALLAEPDWDAWRRDLDRALVAHAGDQEREMDVLRHFQHAQTFRLLAQDLAGRLTVERVADHLSALADVILAAALREVWELVSGTSSAPRFSVIGYGKLGGKELGYASDLDLVFVYDDPTDAGLELYTRVARRLITWLTSNTSAGQLYETDLRLRPDGTKGLVASTFDAFWRYQREHAWTWEHQALTRARFVTGDADLGRRFEAERETFLRLPRDRDRLAREVVEMRRRMHAGHPNTSTMFDLKHDPGGMVDVEFAVQYLVLAHSHDHAELTRNLGNIALLRIAAQLGLLSHDAADRAAAAYRHYRRRQHQLRLTGAAHARVDPDEETAHRTAVSAVWNAVFGAPWSMARA